MGNNLVAVAPSQTEIKKVDQCIQAEIKTELSGFLHLLVNPILVGWVSNFDTCLPGFLI